VHCIGIKGVGMTAIAQFLVQQGYTVTGSDVAEEFPTDVVLSRLNIDVADVFSAAHITDDIEAVVYSTAYAATHIERIAASKRGIPQWSYPEVLGLLSSFATTSIAVAGSHGKTTTTTLVARLLEVAGKNPSAVVGAPVSDWGSNARIGSNDVFVYEADEYQNKFQFYQPSRIVVTNVDYDHPDFFPSEADYTKVFVDFVARLPDDGLLALWDEDPQSAALGAATSARVVRFGASTACQWRLTAVAVSKSGTTFTVLRGEEVFGTFTIPYAGEQYARNAIAALAITENLGVTSDVAAQAFRSFRGTARRMEYIGEAEDKIVIDDYAHHPTEIAALIKALRAAYSGSPLVLVFQPHTASRTAELLPAFAVALAAADVVVVLPIYTSAREGAGTVTSEDLVAAINVIASDKAKMAADFAAAVALVAATPMHSVVVTAGAGDVWQVGRRLLHQK